MACDDKHEKCGEWAADGQCDANPTFMNRECSLACGLCVATCKDREDGAMCKGWAKDGECEANKLFMMRNCPASCGVCHLIDGVPEKDEL
jgi:hypothetical protein